jgi:AcrR family transcriptional regulator
LNENVDVAGASSRIQRAALELIIRRRPSAVTPEELCAISGIPEEQFAVAFSSVEEVFEAIVSGLLEKQSADVEATFARRRSLTVSVQIALEAVWRLVEREPETYQAVELLQLRGAADRSVNPLATRLYFACVTQTAWLLTELGRVQQVRWDVEPQQLARFIVATVGGLITEFLIMKNALRASQTLRVLAYHISQHGRRAAVQPSSNAGPLTVDSGQ